MTIHFQLAERHPRLGRNLRHDSRSLAFPFLSSGAAPVAVQHARRVPIFDQGQLGSCTGNAAVGCIASDPFYATETDKLVRGGPAVMGVWSAHEWTEAGALSVYSDATQLDNITGTYPPDDTGSDGLSVAKVLKNRGWISGYTHVLTGADGVAHALSGSNGTDGFPVIVGVPWYSSMFEPDARNFVSITAGATVEGGHEFVVDQYIPPASAANTAAFGCQNSWGSGWGDAGRFYLTFPTLQRLLSEQGDCTVFSPITASPPQPVTDPALARLIAKTAHWRGSSVPWIGAQGAQSELKRYLATDASKIRLKFVDEAADGSESW
jgi:hypothetical protein